MSQFDDLGVHRDVLAEESEGLCAFLQRTTSRALCLKSRQDYGIARIRQALREMVHDTAASHHAARGNDDARCLHVIDSLGFFGSTGQMELAHIERVAFAATLFARECAQGHGAIDVHRQFGDSLLILELPQVVHKGLRAPNGKRGNHDGAAALGHAIHDCGKHLGGVAGLVIAIPVRRLT